MDILDLCFSCGALRRPRAVPIDGIEGVAFGVTVEPHTHGDGGIDKGNVEVVSELILDLFPILFVAKGAGVCLGEAKLLELQLRSEFSSVPPER